MRRGAGLPPDVISNSGLRPPSDRDDFSSERLVWIFFLGTGGNLPPLRRSSPLNPYNPPDMLTSEHSSRCTVSSLPPRYEAKKRSGAEAEVGGRHFDRAAAISARASLHRSRSVPTRASATGYGRRSTPRPRGNLQRGFRDPLTAVRRKTARARVRLHRPDQCHYAGVCDTGRPSSPPGKTTGNLQRRLA